jgi:hypothetical protein
LEISSVEAVGRCYRWAMNTPTQSPNAASYFVWTKMQADSGQSLREIIVRKEEERAAGGTFWWGIGNSLGRNIRDIALEQNGTLPVLFSVMLSRPQAKDVNPELIYLWSSWEDWEGRIRPLPPHVLSLSRGGERKKAYYALVCHSSVPLAVVDHGPFDPDRYRTLLGKVPGNSQVTALLKGNLYESQLSGRYHEGFRASLVCPWAVKLVKPKIVSREAVGAWKKGDDWQRFVAELRQRQ